MIKIIQGNKVLSWLESVDASSGARQNLHDTLVSGTEELSDADYEYLEARGYSADLKLYRCNAEQLAQLVFTSATPEKALEFSQMLFAGQFQADGIADMVLLELAEIKRPGTVKQPSGPIGDLNPV